MHLFESTVTAFFFICIEELEDNKHCWPGKWEKDQRRWWKVSCGLLVANIRFLLCFCWHLCFFCVAEITVLSFRLNNQHRSLTEIRRPPSLLCGWHSASPFDLWSSTNSLFRKRTNNTTGVTYSTATGPLMLLHVAGPRIKMLHHLNQSHQNNR